MAFLREDIKDFVNKVEKEIGGQKRKNEQVEGGEQQQQFKNFFQQQV